MEQEMDVVRALQAAKKFLSGPQTLSVDDRRLILQKFSQKVSEKAKEWAAIESDSQNLPLDFVLENGVLHTLQIIEQNLKDLDLIEKRSTDFSASGVVAIITPWTLSFRVVMESLIPAVAAGNAAVIKVSSRSAITKKIIEELINFSGVPNGMVQVLVGEGAVVGAFLAAHPGVRAVSFVGRHANAEKVIAATAKQFKKLQIRGGVKNSAVLLTGFDYQKYFSELLNSFSIGSGQLGWNMSRLITTEAELPLLLENLKKEWKVTEQDFPGLNELKQKATGEHGKLFFGNFLIDLPNCSDLQQEELQLPLFPIVTVKYQHELAKWVNNTSYGLLTTVWGEEEKAKKLADKFHSGAVWINHWLRKQDESPMGMKQSGFGIADRKASGAFYSDQKLTQ